MNTKKIVRLSLIVIAIAFLVMASYYFILPNPYSRENDIQKIYDNLPDHSNFDQLKNWCAMTPQTVSKDDKLFLENASRNRDPNEIICDEISKRMYNTTRQIRIDSDMSWYRLSPNLSSEKWIGIGVKQYVFTGWSPQLISFRIKVGF